MSTGFLDFDDEKCKRCGICSFICPARSIKSDTGPSAWRNGLPRLMPIAPGISECIACGCCLVPCPENAISITRPFRPGFFFKRLTQTKDLKYPKRYTENDLPELFDLPENKSGKNVSESESSPVSPKQTRAQKLRQLKLLKAAVASFIRLNVEEIREGRFVANIIAKRRGDPNDISWAQLLESRARQVPAKNFLLYENETFTYRQMDENANRIANFLLNNGGGRGKGLGIFMRNSPRFLDIFFGAQKIGMYLVPINPELKGDGLAYLINHSDVEYFAVDAELLGSIASIADSLKNINQLIVNDIEAEADNIAIPDHALLLSDAYAMPTDNPGIGHNPDDMCLIIYTSGTTGRPKGVVYHYKKSSVKLLTFFAYILLREDDIYYTYLPLCHGNALFITTTMTMARKATMALSRKFSASRFMETLRGYNATVFNTIGSVIPILMKQPEKETDRENNVRFVFSAACPTEMWEPFENRFNVTLYEGYGAVDGGGKGIMNLGTAPVGSLGKPTNPKEVKIIDENGQPVPVGIPGELVFKVKKGKSAVAYYKNEEASRKKSHGGWLNTGDLVRQDENGFIYFVGRNTESMRKSGENVSAYEVEHVIMQHPSVEEVAVYAVPSEMSEDEIMTAVKLVEGQSLTAGELRDFLTDKLAKYAIPRYTRFVEEFPKTTSHRIIKRVLEEEGVTEDTDDVMTA
ncbi:MAG: AMP-binding protein [Desulfobacteraceae bacterium]|nr:AMP-binding protein [Desulfobacteraceae bacterium]MBC2756995.1 AMP-binding protein [Desulfobacteraceae bacterium]